MNNIGADRGVGPRRRMPPLIVSENLLKMKPPSLESSLGENQPLQPRKEIKTHTGEKLLEMIFNIYSQHPRLSVLIGQIVTVSCSKWLRFKDKYLTTLSIFFIRPLQTQPSLRSFVKKKV